MGDLIDREAAAAAAGRWSIEAAEAIRALPSATQAGASRSTKAIGQWFAEMARKAGVRKTLHGLRKYRAQRLIEAGASQAQRKAWIGHLTDAESDHYAKGADQRKILGLETASGNQPETNVYSIENKR